MRSVQMIACPFDSNQLLDRHCIDLLNKKDVTIAGFPCLQVCSCGYKISNRAFRSLFVLRLVFKNLGIHFCLFSLTSRV